MTARADRLAAIEAREKAATPAPWEVDGEGRDICSFDRYQESPLEITDGGSFARNAVENDAAFIAHSRVDVPWLVAEVRRLEAALENIERYNNEMGENGSLYVKVQARAALKDSP